MPEVVQSGISRAIAVAGNQVELSRLIWKVCGKHIWQSRLSEYERVGYVPLANARLISEVTGVPVEDLLRREKRKRRPSKKPEKAS